MCCVAAAVQCDPESMGTDAFETESVHSDRLESKVERVHLEWQALCCSYNSSHGKIEVLQDVWGAALAGEMQVRPAACTAAGEPADSSRMQQLQLFCWCGFDSFH